MITCGTCSVCTRIGFYKKKNNYNKLRHRKNELKWQTKNLYATQQLRFLKI